MATVGGFSRHNHLSELADPLDTQEGILSPAERRQETQKNLVGATYAGSNALLFGIGTSSNKEPLGSTAGSALDLRFTASHTTGDMRGIYERLDFAGAGGSGEAARIFGVVNNVTAATGGTVNGAHISLSLSGASAGVGGAGNALRATLGLGTGVTSSGTLSGVQVDADFASDATLTGKEAGIRFTTSTSKKWPVAFAFDSVVGTGNAIEASDNGITGNASHAIAITIDGVLHYIAVWDNKTFT